MQDGLWRTTASASSALTWNTGQASALATSACGTGSETLTLRLGLGVCKDEWGGPAPWPRLQVASTRWIGRATFLYEEPQCMCSRDLPPCCPRVRAQAAGMHTCAVGAAARLAGVGGEGNLGVEGAWCARQAL